MRAGDTAADTIIADGVGCLRHAVTTESRKENSQNAKTSTSVEKPRQIVTRWREDVQLVRLESNAHLHTVAALVQVRGTAVATAVATAAATAAALVQVRVTGLVQVRVTGLVQAPLLHLEEA